MPEAILGCEVGELVCLHFEDGKWILILESELVETPKTFATFLFGDLCI